MANACDRCAKTVKDNDDFVGCMGFCDHVVHLRCTKMNKSFLKIVSESSNLCWLCDECSKLMKLARFRDTMSSVGAALTSISAKQDSIHEELKLEIAKNGKQIAELAKKISVGTPTRSRSSVFLARPTPKRPREDESIESLITKPLIGGTRLTGEFSVATVPIPEDLFWVYLSRIHPSVEPAAIEKLCKTGLKCEEPVKVIPLVKKGSDLSTLNFISYKIGVDSKYRDAALNPETWPTGVLFREFVDSRPKNFWRPPPSPNATPTIPVLPAVSTPSTTTTEIPALETEVIC